LLWNKHKTIEAASDRIGLSRFCTIEIFNTKISRDRLVQVTSRWGLDHSHKSSSY